MRRNSVITKLSSGLNLNKNKKETKNDVVRELQELVQNLKYERQEAVMMHQCTVEDMKKAHRVEMLKLKADEFELKAEIKELKVEHR